MDEESGRRAGAGWKTAKICITIADRNNYARNARERGGGAWARMQMRAGAGGGAREGENWPVEGSLGAAETRLEMQIRGAL